MNQAGTAGRDGEGNASRGGDAPGGRMRVPPGDAQQAEAAAILRRIAEETNPQLGGPLLGRTLGGLGAHFGAADADAGDRLEVWGTRIGRGLALVAFLALATSLLLQFMPG